MAFAKGKSGNPGGRSKNEKPFRDALNLAIKEMDGDKTKLRKMADALVDKAVAGDVTAIREVADRLDGKPHQTAELTIDDKREVTDWTRAELVEILNNAGNGGGGTAAEDGRSGEPDRVH